jgi:hypothetical protein
MVLGAVLELLDQIEQVLAHHCQGFGRFRGLDPGKASKGFFTQVGLDQFLIDYWMSKAYSWTASSSVRSKVCWRIGAPMLA